MAAQKAHRTVSLVSLLAHSIPAAFSFQTTSRAHTGPPNVTCAHFTFDNFMTDTSGNGLYMASGADTATPDAYTPWTPLYVTGKSGTALHLNEPSPLLAKRKHSWLKGPVIDSAWVGDQYFEISFYLALVNQNYPSGQGLLSFKNTSEGESDDWVHLLWKSSTGAIQAKQKATLLFGSSNATDDNRNGEIVLGPDMYDENVWHTVKLWTTNACGTSTWHLDIDGSSYTKAGVGPICGRQLFVNRHCWKPSELILDCSSRLNVKIDELVIMSDSPTPAPTPSATPAPSPPTPAPAPTGDDSETVSGIGDPHLVNLRGERFDINEPGSFVLVQLPRDAEPAGTLLLVEAGATAVGGPCSVYFQTVTISGAWTNQTEPLLFTADPHSKPSGTFHSVEWMQFGPVGVKVIHWRKHVDFLDIYVKNVGQIGHTVGGLLGGDDHKELAPRPRGCSLSHGRTGRARLESSVAEALS